MITTIVEAALLNESGYKSSSPSLGEEGELPRGGNDLDFYNKQQNDLERHVWSRRKKEDKRVKKDNMSKDSKVRESTEGSGNLKLFRMI